MQIKQKKILVKSFIINLKKYDFNQYYIARYGTTDIICVLSIPWPNALTIWTPNSPYWVLLNQNYHKNTYKKVTHIQSWKNGFAKFIGASTSSCRYGMCLQCIGAECPRNMGSQLPILSAFELKQYPSAKRVHSAKVIWFRWFCQK